MLAIEEIQKYRNSKVQNKIRVLHFITDPTLIHLKVNS